MLANGNASLSGVFRRSCRVTLPAGASLATPTAGGASLRLPARLTRARRPRYGYVVARHLVGSVWLYWHGPNRQCVERWGYRQAEAYRHRNVEAAAAAIPGNALPRDSLILRIRF